MKLSEIQYGVLFRLPEQRKSVFVKTQHIIILDRHGEVDNEYNCLDILTGEHDYIYGNPEIVVDFGLKINPDTNQLIPNHLAGFEGVLREMGKVYNT